MIFLVFPLVKTEQWKDVCTHKRDCSREYALLWRKRAHRNGQSHPIEVITLVCASKEQLLRWLYYNINYTGPLPWFATSYKHIIYFENAWCIIVLLLLLVSFRSNDIFLTNHPIILGNIIMSLNMAVWNSCSDLGKSLNYVAVAVFKRQ